MSPKQNRNQHKSLAENFLLLLVQAWLLTGIGHFAMLCKLSCNVLDMRLPNLGFSPSHSGEYFAEMDRQVLSPSDQNY